MSTLHRKIIDISVTVVLCALAAWAFWSFFRGDIVFDLFSNDSSRFKEYFNSFNSGVASLIYILLVMLEVLIAFIPGWFVYPVGGAIFGFPKTVVLVVIANYIAASISFWIGRKWGTRLLQKFIAQRYITQFNNYMAKRGSLAVFLLKLNPVTSLDIWNYVAGASPMSYWKFSIANILGILPLTMFSAALGEEGFDFAPQLFGVLVVLTVFYVIWFIVNIPQKISGKKPTE